mmetsp:Transcript_13248/g.28575  ORF Transcript_13248/g.28575 Transcript_13248/m.28575 type:complete len:156 (+) Transcript_13248:145-612(+)
MLQSSRQESYWLTTRNTNGNEEHSIDRISYNIGQTSTDRIITLTLSWLSIRNNPHSMQIPPLRSNVPRPRYRHTTSIFKRLNILYPAFSKRVRDAHDDCTIVILQSRCKYFRCTGRSFVNNKVDWQGCLCPDTVGVIPLEFSRLIDFGDDVSSSG